MRDRRNVIPGVPRESERAITGLVAELDERLRRLERSPGRAGIVSSDTAAKPGELLNIEAPVTGLTVILPQPTAALIDARVTLCFRNANPVRLVSISGLVNRESFVLNTAPGTFEAVCDGIDGWNVEIGVSSSGSAADAEYVVATAHASLPNAGVATDTTEVNFSFTPGSIATWVLNTASVAFSKLANLAGLSVLGRAANSSGVMAAITATSARQVLRLNSAGTSLEFAYNQSEQTLVSPMAGGTQNAYVLPSTVKHGDILNWDISGAVTLNGIDSTGFTAGFEFTLIQSNGGFPDGNQVTINDENAGALAANRFATPDNVAVIIGTGGAVRIRRGASRWSIIERGFPRASTSNLYGGLSGRELQRAALTGAVTASQNSNSTLFGVSSTSIIGAGATSMQRAALTGAIAAAQNVNATLFAGIRDNGAAENDRTNLNFLSSTTISLAVTDDAGNDELEITAALIGTTTEVTIVSATGNLGTINIAALECGGSVRVTSASSAYSIEGFTAKTNGFWFYFEAAQGATNHCTLFDEDATATAANRLQLPLSEDINQSGEIRGIFYYRNSRWNFTGNDPKRIGTTTTGVVVTGTQINLAVPASDINITAGGNVNVTGSGTGLLVGCNTFVDGYLDMTEQATVTAPGAAHGKVWVDSGAVQALRFTDDSGNDRSVSGGTNAWQTFSTSGTQQNVALNEQTMFLKLTAGAGTLLGGLANGWDGRVLYVIPGANATFGVNHADAGSSAANQISCPGGVNISGNRFGCILVYDAADTVWRVAGVNPV